MKFNTQLGIYQFECDKDLKGIELDNYSQRNNEIVWPSKDEYPKTQYQTTWKNTCNVTSYIMGLLYAGFKFPSGKYKQPEDNLAYFILTNEKIREEYKNKQPAMYNLFIKALKGECSKHELDNMYFPTELHDYLCFGANKWLGTTAAKFSTNIDFRKALWENLVIDNLPMVISTNFGGFGHIVTVTGVQYSKETYNKIKTTLNFDIDPLAIIVDDPWGNASSTDFASYPAGGGSGNDIVVPWKTVIKRVKPYNSQKIKWAHTFNHAVATI